MLPITFSGGTAKYQPLLYNEHRWLCRPNKYIIMTDLLCIYLTLFKNYDTDLTLRENLSIKSDLSKVHGLNKC